MTHSDRFMSFVYIFIYEVVIHLCLHALILENKVTKK